MARHNGSFWLGGSRWKLFIVAALAAILLAGLLAVVVGWYYSNLLHSGAFKADYSPHSLHLRIVEIGENSIVLEPESTRAKSLELPGIWGLKGENGYGQVGKILETNGQRVRREFTPMQGTITTGDLVRLDSFAYTGGPRVAQGLPFEEVFFPSELGDMPAWYVPGEKGTWVIFVHGWRSDRDEALRVVPLIHSLGYASLVIDYRNDEGAPASSDGLIQFGATEWRDLEAAVNFAVSQGADDVVLYGYSMGGSIVLSFLYNSEAANRARAAILDAPMADFNAVVEMEAEGRGLPGFVTWLGKQFASLRFDVDWAELNYLSGVGQIEVPVLLFHGEEDDRVPVETSDTLAAARPDIVSYFRVVDAGHVRAWNIDPHAYEAAVTGFLSQVEARD